jgi:hypothetical protein
VAERLSAPEKKEFLDQIKLFFEKFNRQIEETIRGLCDFADQIEIADPAG